MVKLSKWSLTRRQMGAYPAQWKLDFESALNRHSQVVKVIDIVRELQEYGVVETAPPEALGNSGDTIRNYSIFITVARG